jgi:hypothetical protein
MKSARELLNDFYAIKVALRELGVIRSERFTGELGEWLVETAYKGQRAKGTTQKGWDVELCGENGRSLLQVKTHAKGEKNNARWTKIKPECLELFDRLVIVVLSDKYDLKEWYDVSKEDVRKTLVQSGKSWVIYWDDIKPHSINWKKLPGADAISDFE